MKNRGFFLFEALVSLSIFCIFLFCFFKFLFISLKINKKIKSLSLKSTENYRLMDYLKKDIKEASEILVVNKKELLLKRGDMTKKYFFTEYKNLLVQEKDEKKNVFIEGILGEFSDENNLIIIKLKKDNERQDYVFFKKQKIR